MTKIIEMLYLMQKHNQVYYNNNLKINTKTYLQQVCTKKYKNKECKIIFIDVDNLKKINDTYGHDFGDIYIKSIINRLKSMNGVLEICRYGGDEFILICHHSFNEFKLLKVDTISFGCFKKSKKSSVIAGIKIADERMYRMKQQKRKGC